MVPHTQHFLSVLTVYEFVKEPIIHSRHTSNALNGKLLYR